MALIGNNSDTLLKGLSSFWLKYFADLGDLRATYEGTEILLGQAYLDMLTSVLGVSVNNTPLFHREYFRLLTIREDQVTFADTGNPVTSQFVFLTNDIWTDIPQLQNTVWSPSAALEENVDYTVVAGSIRFPTNPLNTNNYSGGVAQPVPGFGISSTTIGINGVFTSSANFYNAGVRNGDTLKVTAVSPTASLQTGSFPILQATSALLAFAPGTVLPADLTQNYTWVITRTLVKGGSTKTVYTSGIGENGTFRAQNTLSVNQIALWAVDGRFDEFTLYENFGHLVGAAQLSSENYRGFIRGVMQLYIFGPAIKRLESALNVMANLPVVQSNGETLIEYYIDATNQYVVTSANTYVYPLGIPIRPDIVALTAGPFEAFEPLTTAITVADYISNPEWWYNITIPEALLPGRRVSQRRVDPQLYPNIIGANGLWLIGDPGSYIGADEEDAVGTPSYRHVPSFYLMQKYLKTHLLYVTIDPNIELTGILVQNIVDLFQAVKPAHTMIYFEPITSFEDSMIFTDTLTVVPQVALDAEYIATGNALTIGGSWTLGEGFKFNVDHTVAVGPASGDPTLCPLILGGQGLSGTLTVEMPLYVNAYAVYT